MPSNYMQIPLSGSNGAGYYAKVDPEDYAWISKYNWYLKDGYAVTKDKTGKNFRMHRLVMQETDLDIVIDHKDRDRLNNQKSNLRRYSLVQNANNRSNNREITAFGEHHTIAEWTRDPRCAVSERVLRGRLDKEIIPEFAILAEAD